MDGKTLVAVEWSLVGFTMLLVLLRLYARRHILSIADVFVIIGWTFFVGQAVTDTLLQRIGSFANVGDNSDRSRENVISMLKIMYAANGMYYTGLYCIKAAMLYFFSNLILRSYMGKTWIALQVTIAVTSVGFVVTTLLGFLWCQPVSRNWSLNDDTYCFNGEGIPYITPFIFHMLTDVMIYSLAFPVMGTVTNLALRERIALGFTFGIGFLCLAFGVGTFVMYMQVPPSAYAALSAVLEQTWSVTVVCCPAFKVLFRRDVKRWTNKFSTIGGRGPRSVHPIDKTEVEQSRSSWGSALSEKTREIAAHGGEGSYNTTHGSTSLGKRNVREQGIELQNITEESPNLDPA